MLPENLGTFGLSQSELEYHGSEDSVKFEHFEGLIFRAEHRGYATEIEFDRSDGLTVKMHFKELDYKPRI